jgi:hypothetical protein
MFDVLFLMLPGQNSLCALGIASEGIDVVLKF